MNELQSLSQIFQNKLFRIPDYQRGYAWLDQQLRDFWEDLINLQPDRYHYTGLLSMKELSRKEAKKLDQEDQWLLESGFKPYHSICKIKIFFKGHFVLCEIFFNGVLRTSRSFFKRVFGIKVLYIKRPPPKKRLIVIRKSVLAGSFLPHAGECCSFGQSRPFDLLLSGFR